MTKKRTVLPVVLLSAACVQVAAAHPNTRPAPPDDAHAPRHLLELRDRLAGTERADALAAMSSFRPLCDDEGYPLVGNVIRKARVYQVSEFCTDVRDGARSTGNDA